MKHRFFVILFFITVFYCNAQDPGFSQFYANPIYLNPAFTGTTELARTVINYRNQWPQKGSTFTTYSISYDKLFAKANSGIGIQFIRDQELNNVITGNSVMGSYSHHIKINKFNFLTLAIQGGMVLKQFNANGLVFPSGINQLSGEINGTNPANFASEKKMYPDFAVGALGQQNQVFYGVSFHHLTQPNESIIEGDQKGELPVKITLHAGAYSKRLHHGLLSREFTLSPNIIYQHQGSFKQLNLGIYMIEKSLLFGGWFRNNFDIRPDAIILLIGLSRERFKFGYSYDITLSKLNNYSFGSHEISLSFFIGELKGFPPKNKILIPMI